jgi:hypothetical protein
VYAHRASSEHDARDSKSPVHEPSPLKANPDTCVVRRSDVVPVAAVGAAAEVALGSGEVLNGSAPLFKRTGARRLRPEGLVGGDDGVVEAVGLDALSGLLPGAPRARVCRGLPERCYEVWAWLLYRVAHVLAAAKRELRLKCCGAFM